MWYKYTIMSFNFRKMQIIPQNLGLILFIAFSGETFMCILDDFVSDEVARHPGSTNNFSHGIRVQ